jgi:outer membrane protein assembly factor BamB
MLLKTILLFGVLSAMLAAEDWLQFRGPNGSGISTSTGLPVEFGPDKNMVWKTPVPPGQSSPVVAGDRIFLTALENNKLFTLGLERATGRIQWRREVPRPRLGNKRAVSVPASPSPVSDGKNVYAFFDGFGLISFGPDGNERWNVPLGPFMGPFDLSSSPILVGDTLLQLCDAETGSFLIAIDTATGKVKWRKERPEVTRGAATPVIYRPAGGPAQVLVPGSYKLTSYSIETGDEIWFAGGITWQLVPTPVLGKDVIYVLGLSNGHDAENLPPFVEMLKRLDKNHDGKLSKEEFNDPEITNARTWSQIDSDGSGYVDEREWEIWRTRRATQDGFTAFRLGGKGDMTSQNFLWRYTRALPIVSSPLLYQNVLYLVKDGGILTTLDPQKGEVLKQGRITGAMGQYFSSPVAADGKIYTATMDGKVSVLKAGGQWELLKVNDLGEECPATPAIADGKIYVRTRSALYCFAKKD